MPTTSQAPRGRGRKPAAIPPLRLDPAAPSQAVAVHDAIRAAILSRLLGPGERLPSTRELAPHFGLGRNAVVAAYEHLAADGLIESRHGSGSHVSPLLPPGAEEAATAAPSPRLHGRRKPFALGQTHVDPALLARLGAAVRRQVAGASLADLSYGDPRGAPKLREALAEFLALGRGIRCGPEDIAVVSGTQHGLRLCADALLSPGDCVWVEEPGYPAARTTLRAAGAVPVPAPVDAHGFDLAAALAQGRARAAYVTPSHQFPTGVAMEMSRRAALIDWAESAGGWIFEDDYDSEFRYAGPPLTALAGLSRGRVIYLGTFAKILFPGLRLGWVVAPPAAMEAMLDARAALDRFPAVFMQNAVAALMADGSLATHLRRNLRRYRAARDMTVATLREASGGALDAQAPEQGLHLIAWLGEGADAARAARIRAAAGVDAALVSETCLGPRAGREGFVLGFSGHDEAAIEAAARALGAAARRSV